MPRPPLPPVEAEAAGAAFRHAPDPLLIFRADATGRLWLVAANGAAERFGIAAPGAAAALWPAPLGSRLAAALVHALETDRRATFAAPALFGGEGEWEATLTPIPFADGRAVLAACHEVSHHRAAEIEARFAARRLDIVLRGAELGVFEWHVPTGAIVVDARAAAMLGQEPEALGPDLDAWMALLHPADARDAWTALHDVVAGRRPAYNTEPRLLHADGHWVRLLARGGVVERDPAGAPILVAATLRDVTTARAQEAALRQARGDLEAAVEGAALGAWSIDLTTGRRQGSDRCAAMLGDPPGAAPGTRADWAARLHPEDRAAALARLDAHLRGDDPGYRSAHRLRRADGAYAHVLEWGRAVAREPGAPAALLSGLVMDVTAERAAEARLAESEAAFRLLAVHSGDVVVRLGRDGAIRYASPAAERVLGLPPPAMVGRRLPDFADGLDHAALAAALAPLDAGDAEAATVTCRFPRAGGSIAWLEVHARRAEEGELVASLRDATDRILAEEQLREALERLRKVAATDGLTGIANRSRFDEILAREWSRAGREARPLGLLMIDADHFKAYNDHHGHAAGDRCLRLVAAILDAAAHRPGDLAARYGGEEFALILPDTDAPGAATVGERVLDVLALRAMPHGATPLGRVTVSIGAAAVWPSPTGGPDPSALIEAADRALYAAKRAGRNQVALGDTLGGPWPEAMVLALPAAPTAVG